MATRRKVPAHHVLYVLSNKRAFYGEAVKGRKCFSHGWQMPAFYGDAKGQFNDAAICRTEGAEGRSMSDISEPQKIRKLKRLQASEVSLVSRGAIKRPFLVVKNEQGAQMAEPAQQFLLTPEQETAIDGVLAKHQRVSKAFGDGSADADAVPGDALRENVDAETGEGAGDDEGLDARSLAALKAVFRILQPFKGQITEDMVDDVLAELDLDGTGEDGQDTDEDDIGDEDEADDDTDDTLTEDDQAMADDKFNPEDLKKAADSWSPSKPAGMSNEDFSKAVAAAKSAFNNIGKAADNADDEDEGDKEKAEKSAVTKSLLSKMAPEHAELVRKADNARYEAIAKAAALEERVAKMEGERILKSYEEDIKKDCITLGKDPVQQARILKSQFDANKEAGEQYRAILRDSARMTHESGIFKSVGTSHNSGFGASVPTDGQGSPDQQLQSMLQSAVQKGEAQDETAAWTAVMKTQRGRELYELSRKGVH